LEPTDVWTDLGFKDNPYNHRPLKVSEEDRALFVGRVEEAKRLILQTSGTKGGIVTVEGKVGVGKTSFVNAAQYDLSNIHTLGLLPSFETIDITGESEIGGLLLSTLSNATYAVERLHGKSVTDKTEAFKRGKELVERSSHVGWGAQITLFGVGGGVSRQETATTPPSIILPTIIQTFDRFTESVVDKLNRKGIIIPLNNFDNLSETDIISLLNRARDVALLRPRTWWILIGPPGMFSLLESKARRISEIITGEPISLNPLSLAEVHQAIDLRIKKLRLERNVKPPIPSTVVDLLYEVSNGEIRYIFKRLTDITITFKLRLPSLREVPEEAAADILRELASSKLQELALTKKDTDSLQKMVEGAFRVRDYQKFGFKSQQAFMRQIKKLHQLGLLVRIEENPRVVSYLTSGDVNLIFKSPPTVRT
jgi:hypothetical protein